MTLKRADIDTVPGLFYSANGSCSRYLVLSLSAAGSILPYCRIRTLHSGRGQAKTAIFMGCLVCTYTACTKGVFSTKNCSCVAKAHCQNRMSFMNHMRVLLLLLQYPPDVKQFQRFCCFNILIAAFQLSHSHHRQVAQRGHTTSA